MRLRSWNAVTLLELAQCDALVTPTEFQQQFPGHIETNFVPIHEGIDVTKLLSLRTNLPTRPHWMQSDPSIRIVTHLARG